MSDSEIESENEFLEAANEDKKKYSKPEYMTVNYKIRKHKFEESLREFDVSLFEFKEWSVVKNKYIKQYLLLEYIQKLFATKSYNCKYINNLYLFIQSKLNSKEIKAADVIMENNVIKEIRTLIILNERDYMVCVEDDEDDAPKTTSSASTSKIKTIHKLWNDYKKRQKINCLKRATE